MNAKTLKALRGSIEKWERIVAGTGVDGGESNCDLCQVYLDCSECPVQIRTNLFGCRGTPYDEWVLWDAKRDSLDPINPKIHTKGVRLAQAELDFLRGLLPEGK